LAGAVPGAPGPAAPTVLAAAANTKVAPQSASAAISLGGATSTRTADITLTVPPPTGPASLLRISNDAGTTWVELPYVLSLSWSLIDPAAGGVDADGPKMVTVQGGDGIGPWVALGTSTILLDRTPPTTSGLGLSLFGWLGVADLEATDTGVGVARTEVSLDGIHWRSLDPSPYSFYGPGVVDVRDGTIGGSWDVGPRTIYTRAVDKLGNVSEPQLRTVSPTDQHPDGEVPARFEYPLPAVSGQPFTVDPVFVDGFHVPAGAYCRWRLATGTAQVRLEGGYDETYQEVQVPVSAVGGICQPWTFTLPYTPPLEYSVSLMIMAGENESLYVIEPLAGSFRAALGSTSRAITSSNLPLFYVEPDRELVSASGIVTYRLRTAGGMSSADGWWSCGPAVHPEVNQYSPQSQFGGSSFACRVTSSGPWVADWARFANGRRWNAGYDPIGDRSKPTITSTHVDVASGAAVGTGTTVTVRWTGHDSGTGLSRYQVQVSRNGGAYASLTLASRLAVSINRTVVFGSSYQFRIRAIDRAGNVGAWVYTGSIRPARYDDRSSTLTWTSGWATTPSSGTYGTTVHETTRRGAVARFAFAGRGVAWLARRGPDAGFAQVWVDGVLASTINLTSPTSQPSRVVWRRTWTVSGAHVVRIVALGTSGRPAVEVDALVVLR
jgi:hypothetical protein